MIAQQISLTFRNLGLFPPKQNIVRYKNSPHIIKNFQSLFKIRLNNLLYFYVSYQVPLTLSRGKGVGRLHLVCILSRIIIRLDLLPVNLQAYVMPPSWKTSLCLFIKPITIQIDLLPAKLQLDVPLSSYDPAAATVYIHIHPPNYPARSICFL